MTSNRPTPLDRMRRYVSSLQEADRPAESYVSVALGDLAAVVTHADVLRADHADPALGWTTAAIEAAEYERTKKILDEVVLVVNTNGSVGLRNAVDSVIASVPGVTDGDQSREWGTGRDHLVYDLQSVRGDLALERKISADRLTKIRELEKQLKEQAKAPEAGELEEENTLQRQDIEDLQNQKEDLEGKVKELERALAKEQELVLSLRLNGARHWFAFGYDRPSINGSPYAQYCSVCDKDKDHPAHFQSGAKYLDSRDVEKAARAAQGRLEALLHSGLSMRPETASATVSELLAGLPGIPEGKKPQQEPRAERYCNCGAPESDHPYRHPFDPGPPNDPPEGE